MPRLAHVVWHVTNRCNFRCSYCYVSAGTFNEELSRDKTMGIIGQLNEMDLSTLSLTGGEPTVNRLFSEIICNLRRDVPKHIATNGSTLTPNLLMQLRDANFEKITVSMDSVNPSINDLTRGAGTHISIGRGLHLAMDHGFWVEVPIQVSRLNMHDLAGTVLELAELGVNSIKINFVEDLGYAIGRDLSLSISEREAVIDRLRPVIQEVKENYGLLMGIECGVPFPKYFTTFGGGGCLCGDGRAIIKHDGGLVPCDVMEYPSGYETLAYRIPMLPEEDLAVAFDSSDLFLLYRDATGHYRPRGCDDCEFFRFCRGGCRSIAFLLAKSLFVRTPQCYKGPYVAPSVEAG